MLCSMPFFLQKFSILCYLLTHEMIHNNHHIYSIKECSIQYNTVCLQCPAASVQTYQCKDADIEENARKACQHLRGNLFSSCHPRVCDLHISVLLRCDSSAEVVCCEYITF